MSALIRLAILFGVLALCQARGVRWNECKPNNKECNPTACQNTKCRNHPQATCINFCRGCVARFYITYYYWTREVTNDCELPTPDSRCANYEGLSHLRGASCRGRRYGRPCKSNEDCKSGQICCPAGACGLLCRDLPVVDPNCPQLKGKRKRRALGTYQCFSNADCKDGLCCDGPISPWTLCITED
uniref:uncharacterized protein LOC120334212 n=1 Tax=Styela clava TaxID=7725 RepID=UPI001939CFE6|nr:uncharacterized protein LOC120334212 [Styela clava]